MFQLKDTTLACQRKDCPGYYDWVSVDGCYECPKCGLEVWGGKSTRQVSTRDAEEVYRLHQARLALIRKQGGGGGNGKIRKPVYRDNPNVVGVKPWLRDYDSRGQ